MNEKAKIPKWAESSKGRRKWKILLDVLKEMKKLPKWDGNDFMEELSMISGREVIECINWAYENKLIEYHSGSATLTGHYTCEWDHDEDLTK